MKHAQANNAADAVELYKAAAQRGYAKAQFELWWAYRHGRGVKKDLNEAAKWCKASISPRLSFDGREPVIKLETIRHRNLEERMISGPSC